MHTRREFLRAAAAAAAAGAALAPGRRALGLDDRERREALEKPLPLRALGATGRKVSCLGLGCFYLGSVRDEDAAVGVIRRALDLGVTYFDTAPSYSRGVAEERLGRALEAARARDRVFVATKSTCRDGSAALKELEESLRRLRTDHVDLFQYHAVRVAQDGEALFAKGGAHEALARAKEQGKVRHIGFSGHEDAAVVAAFLRERTADTVLMPLNCIDPHAGSFEEGALPVAREKGVGVIAMKVFASGRLLGDAALSPSVADCVRYSLTLPVATAIVGCSTVAELEDDLVAAKTFRPLDAKERTALLERTGRLRKRDPGLEWYKRRK